MMRTRCAVWLAGLAFGMAALIGSASPAWSQTPQQKKEIEKRKKEEEKKAKKLKEEQKKAFEKKLKEMEKAKQEQLKKRQEQQNPQGGPAKPNPARATNQQQKNLEDKAKADAEKKQKEIQELQKKKEDQIKREAEKKQKELAELQKKKDAEMKAANDKRKKELQDQQNKQKKDADQSKQDQEKRMAVERKKAEQAKKEADRQARERQKQLEKEQREIAARQAKMQKQHQEHVEEIFKQNLNLKEGEGIKRAYIYATMPNAVYDGHRARAMELLQEAARRLDKKILDNGTPDQARAALQQDVEAYRVKFMRKFAGIVHEPQAIADMQIMVSYRILAEQVRPILLRRGDQPGVLDLVDSAMGQLHQALMYRATGR